ncbi:uncharacterized protein LOC131662869 [Phymastichus coffea]|uniref:uncharacterized protein LOC131662869 n=1 Tax=Phymastichus coffea TaxID=108790 RepID=UPI00273A7A8D|nr:uncharacterized protein LOC131662869 [Phymastichus coffea]XP_058788834.1 uncharacterized protein LOC131662869 [Phymastichus coffea]
MDISEKEYQSMYDQCYRGSAKINIASHFGEYKKIIDRSSFHKHYEKDNKAEIIKLLGNEIDEEKFDLLAYYCNIDKLTVDGELEKMNKSTFEFCKDPYDPSIVDNVQLETVKYSKQRNQLKSHQVHLKYRSEKPIRYDPVPLQRASPVLVPESDILVFIRVYVPFTSRYKQSVGALGKLSLNFVIVMHGSQTLDKLRDQIICPSDYAISTEASEIPIRSKTKNAKDVYKSGFFFIEDTFYNDFRDPLNKDNSKVIIEWAQTRNLGPYKTAKMEETTVASIAMRFGYPWVYQHQGDCEHLITFSDVRFVNASDELNSECYPKIVRIKPRPNRYCMTCGIYSVAWVTTSNNRLPHNPCLFCDSCFKSYNYVKGKKIGSFKAYPYPYDVDLLQPQLNDYDRMYDTQENSENTVLTEASADSCASTEDLKNDC